jgi:lipoprotein-releasing system permease protein
VRVDLFLSVKLLKDSRTQSLLIALGVAVGVAVVIFLAALIDGLQKNLISKTVGSQAHIAIRSAQERPRPLRNADDVVVVKSVERIAQRVRSLDGWQALLRRLQQTEGIAAVTPICRGPATAIRGNAINNVVVSGIEIASYQKIIDLESNIISGSTDISGRGVLLGIRLADELGVGLGDKIRLEAGAGEEALASSEVFEVRGILELGNRNVDATWAIVSLRNGQSLLNLSGGATELEASVTSLFAAAEIAGRIRAETALDAESWMESNAELLAGLRSQSSSSLLIQVFVLLAVTIGIASVLVVSVVQRKREIGILRAIGLTRAQTQRVFLLQGALLSLTGAIAGCGLGAALLYSFQTFVTNQEGRPLFPIDMDARLFLVSSAIALGVGILAALLPARSAARLDPAVAIRND